MLFAHHHMVGLVSSVSSSLKLDHCLAPTVFVLLLLFHLGSKTYCFRPTYVNSWMLVFEYACYSFANLSVRLSFLLKGLILSLYIVIFLMEEKISLSATTEEDNMNSVSVVCLSSHVVSRIFSVTLNSSLKKKPAAVLSGPPISAHLKMKCIFECVPQCPWSGFV